MEFPILDKLPLPATCRKLVTQFLREAHPTAELIKWLHFRREEAQESDYVDEGSSACLLVSGHGLRFWDSCLVTPRYIESQPNIMLFPGGARIQGWTYSRSFSYDDITGEPIDE